MFQFPQLRRQHIRIAIIQSKHELSESHFTKLVLTGMKKRDVFRPGHRLYVTNQVLCHIVFVKKRVRRWIRFRT